jgi:hypothetical protein
MALDELLNLHSPPEKQSTPTKSNSNQKPVPLNSPPTSTTNSIPKEESNGASPEITSITLPPKEEEPQFWSYEDYLRKTFNKNWKPVREDYSPLTRTGRITSPDRNRSPQSPSPKKIDVRSSLSPKRSPTYLASSIQILQKEEKKPKPPPKFISSPKRKLNLVEQVAAIAKKVTEEQRHAELQNQKKQELELTFDEPPVQEEKPGNKAIYSG